jgi:hypothetical protein
MQPVASIAGRHWTNPTTGKHRATSTSPGSTKTGDRMHNEKSRTAWLHFQQGLPCLSAVAPTPPGALHAPRVKEKTVWTFLLNAMAASSTDDRPNWRSYLSPHSCPRSLPRIFVPARRNRCASSFVTPAFASPLLPFGMGVSGTHSPNG